MLEPTCTPSGRVYQHHQIEQSVSTFTKSRRRKRGLLLSVIVKLIEFDFALRARMYTRANTHNKRNTCRFLSFMYMKTRTYTHARFYARTYPITEINVGRNAMTMKVSKMREADFDIIYRNQTRGHSIICCYPFISLSVGFHSILTASIASSIRIPTAFCPIVLICRCITYVFNQSKDFNIFSLHCYSS